MTRRSNECFPYARNYYKSFTPTCVTLSTTLCRRFCFFFLLQMGRLRYKLLDNLSQSETTLISIRARFWAWQSGFRGFLGDSNGKESACVAGDLGLIPGPGRSGEGKGYPLQYSCLENSMDRGYSPWGLKESDKIERLTHTNTHQALDFPLNQNKWRFFW